jgi:hypothetical protein
MGNEFKKIRIIAYKDAACNAEIGSIDAFINPDSYSISLKPKYVQERIVGSKIPTKTFVGIGDETLKLGRIIVDGTGVVTNGKPITSVADYIAKFRKLVCDYNGDIHSPNFLKISWGDLKFICICNSFEVKYTLFKPDGLPLRAEIVLGLDRTEDFKTIAKKARANSPDLTHLRIFKAGDSLPLMCYRIYGDSSYYLDVARKNNLNSVSDLKPGDPIYFYPLKK